LIKGGTLDIETILAHVESGSTDVNKLTVFSNLPKNNTIALFILEAAKTHVQPHRQQLNCIPLHSP